MSKLPYLALIGDLELLLVQVLDILGVNLINWAIVSMETEDDEDGTGGVRGPGALREVIARGGGSHQPMMPLSHRLQVQKAWLHSRTWRPRGPNKAYRENV